MRMEHVYILHPSAFNPLLIRSSVLHVLHYGRHLKVIWTWYTKHWNGYWPLYKRLKCLKGVFVTFFPHLELICIKTSARNCELLCTHLFDSFSTSCTCSCVYSFACTHTPTCVRPCVIVSRLTDCAPVYAPSFILVCTPLSDSLTTSECTVMHRRCTPTQLCTPLYGSFPTPKCTPVGTPVLFLCTLLCVVVSRPLPRAKQLLMRDRERLRGVAGPYRHAKGW